MKPGADIKKLSVYVTFISPIKTSNYGQYQYAKFYDVNGELGSLTLLGKHMGKLKKCKVHTFQNLVKKEGQEMIRLKTANNTLIQDPDDEKVSILFKEVQVGEAKVKGTVKLIHEIHMFNDTDFTWCLVVEKDEIQNKTEGQEGDAQLKKEDNIDLAEVFSKIQASDKLIFKKIEINANGNIINPEELYDILSSEFLLKRVEIDMETYNGKDYATRIIVLQTFKYFSFSTE